jgi:hypothetical protein
MMVNNSININKINNHLKSLKTKRPWHVNGNPGPGLGKAQTCGRILFIGIKWGKKFSFKSWVREWWLYNNKREISHLYHGENKSLLDEMMTMSVLN